MDKKGVLVSLMGDFHSSVLPIYYEMYDELEVHLLVHDDARRDDRVSGRLLRGMRRYALERERSPRLLEFSLDEDDPLETRRLLAHLSELCDRDFTRVLLNATDGLASFAFPLACELQKRGATLLAYDRFDDHYNLIGPQGYRHEEILHPMDIESQLVMRDYTILQRTSTEELLERKEVIYRLAKDLTRYKAFADRVSKLRDCDLVKGYDDLIEGLRTLGKHRDIKYIQGTLFEEYIALLMMETEWFDEVWCGVKVRFDDELENEFDVLMTRRNHLHTVECKLVKRLDGEHFVYKTDTVMEYLDEDSRAMILSVGAPNESHRKGRLQRLFTRGDYARARDAGITIYQTERFEIKPFIKAVYEAFIAPYEKKRSNDNA
jgi:glycosyltransferase involved in cell wall biosynthesis